MGIKFIDSSSIILFLYLPVSALLKFLKRNKEES
jgi:hypothetical protein